VCIGRSRLPLFSLLFTPHSTLYWFSSIITMHGLRREQNFFRL
jgi:hypothetical protein